jgi:arginine exporter protein ArgO
MMRDKMKKKSISKKKMKKKKKKTLKMLVVTLLGPLDEKVPMGLNMVALGLPKIH